MLVHLAEVVLQDLQLLLSGSHWLLSGHLLVGQGYGARCLTHLVLWGVLNAPGLSLADGTAGRGLRSKTALQLAESQLSCS